MRRAGNIAKIFALAFAMVFSSCKKYGVSDSTTNGTTSAASVIPGSWIVTSYTQRGEDKTSQFSGYIFTFTASASGANSGTVTAAKDNNSVSGTWSYSPAVTYYGSTSTSSIVLGLGAITPLDKLTKIWNIESTTASKLNLVNPEVLEDEHLVFSKQ